MAERLTMTRTMQLQEPRGGSALAGGGQPSSARKPAISVEAVDVGFGQRRVLRNVSAAAECGTVTAIIGPNGAGKSTLLRVMAGVLLPGGGRVLIGGRAVGELPPGVRARTLAFAASGTGSGASGLAAAAGLSVGQYSAIGGAGLVPAPTPEAACAAVGNALARVGLLERATEPLGVLSSGLQQLATLARVLVQLDGQTEPESGLNRRAGGEITTRADLTGKVLLLDEPTGAMDPRHVGLVLAILADLATRGCAVLLATHDLALAARAGRVLMLRGGGEGGSVVAQGASEYVLTEKNLAEVYGVEFDVIARPGERLAVLARW